MNYKKTIPFLFCILMLAGCTTKKAADSPVIKDLEPYQEQEIEKEEPSKYSYLKNVTLENEDISVKTYALDSKDFSQKDTSVTSSLDGITVDLSLVEETAEKIAGGYMEDAYHAEKAFIEGKPGMQDFKVFDMIEKEGYWILEMDYNRNDGNGILYPCISVIKMDKLENGFLLMSTIRIDNAATNENTPAVLEEILKVYGVTLA